MSKKAKTNNPLATRRLGNRPKAEQVRTVDPEKNAGAAVKAAKKQNTSLLPDNTRVRNFVPTNSAKTKTNTSK